MGQEIARVMPKNKPKFTESQVRDALEKAGTISGAACILECERKTVYAYLKLYPDLKTAIADARERMLDLAETGLMDNISDKHPPSIFFFLKTMGKNRGYTERTEITGKDGDALEIKTQAATDFEHSVTEKLKAASAGKVPEKSKPRGKSKA